MILLEDPLTPAAGKVAPKLTQTLSACAFLVPCVAFIFMSAQTLTADSLVSL